MPNPDLIAEAKANLGEECETVKDAALAFWGHGFTDEQAGNATEPPFEHVFRVGHVIVRTDERGFTALEEYTSEALAEAAFREHEERLEVDEDAC